MDRIHCIMQRNGCDERQARIIAGDLEKLNPALQPLLARWEATGAQDDDTLYEGYSVSGLMERFDLKFTGALLTIDWLLRDPETAKKVIAQGMR